MDGSIFIMTPHTIFMNRGSQQFHQKKTTYSVENPGFGLGQ
jgi:hypothetical protein